MSKWPKPLASQNRDPKPTHIINHKKIQNLVEEAESSSLADVRGIAYTYS